MDIINRLHIKPLLALVLSIMTYACANAQIDATLSQYWNVPSYYNPAATGDVDFIHITAGSRLQWVGIRHAPMTFMGLADMPFKFMNRRWGCGVSLEQESMGLFSSLRAGAQLSWKKKMLGGTLSVGVQAGIINQSFKGDSIIMPEGDEAHESNDEAIPAGTVTGTALDLSGGVMFTHKWFWASASVTHINSPTVNLKVENDEEKRYEFDAGRLYYFMAGSNIPVKNTLFEIQPSVMFRTDTKFYSVEATARMRYNKFLSAGIGYRHNDALSLLIGANYKGFFISYSYDYPTSAISKASTGSHELFVSYNVKLDMGEKNRNKHKSIRIM
ncbi:MAG: PorP/SprF family type IX secretion system membrane protein [Bacteroidales bacterium]|nr:PorP/SprF family type IX secretion system membrane protein [Candidatus Sodaliphilus aphodohippi]